MYEVSNTLCFSHLKISLQMRAFIRVSASIEVCVLPYWSCLPCHCLLMSSWSLPDKIDFNPPRDRLQLQAGGICQGRLHSILLCFSGPLGAGRSGSLSVKWSIKCCCPNWWTGPISYKLNRPLPLLLISFMGLYGSPCECPPWRGPDWLATTGLHITFF